MANTIESYGIFIASPGGLGEERQAFRDEIEEFNRSVAKREGIQFEAIGWEATLGGMGRPQGKINEDLRRCDFFILMLCDRWGMHPGGESGYTSGTEEEYHEAMKCVEAGTMYELIIMFKPADIKQLNDPGKQLSEVLKFKEKIEQEKQHLYETFDSIGRFRSLVRAHLYDWLSKLKSIKNQGTEKKTNSAINQPDLSTTDNEELSENKQLLDISEEIKKAWALANEGKLTEAEIVFARVIINSQDFNPLIDYSQFLIRIGLLARAEGMLNEAVKIAGRKKLDNSKPNFDHYSKLSTIYNQLGVVEMNRGNIKASLVLQNKSLELAKKGGNPYLVGDCYLKLGHLEAAQSKLDNALIMFDYALAEHKESNIIDAMAVDYMAIGQVHYRKNNLDYALKAVEKAYELHVSIHGEAIEDWFMADISNVIGQINMEKGMFAIAEERFKKGLIINEKLGRNNDIASSYGNLGSLYEKQDNLDEAEKMQRLALNLEEKSNFIPGIAVSCANIGDILRKRGNLDESAVMLRRAAAMFERAGNPHKASQAYELLNQVLTQNGKTPEKQP